jgi:hypothetical protein
VNHRGLPTVLEPIADFPQYLARARYDRKRIPPDLLDLLETWNLTQPKPPAFSAPEQERETAIQTAGQPSLV